MGNLSQSTPTNNLPESWLFQKVRKKLDTTFVCRSLILNACLIHWIIH